MILTGNKNKDKEKTAKFNRRFFAKNIEKLLFSLDEMFVLEEYLKISLSHSFLRAEKSGNGEEMLEIRKISRNAGK